MARIVRIVYMKKLQNLILLFVSLLCLCACGKEETEHKNRYQVYYVNTSETKVEMHEYQMKALTPEEKLEELITCLSTMPEKLEYKAPLAMGFQIVDLELEDGKILIDVNAEYKKLPATTEVLVRAAIVRTLTQLDEISYVGITVEGNPLIDNAGEVVGFMSAEQFIDNDGNEINTYELCKCAWRQADWSISGEALFHQYTIGAFCGGGTDFGTKWTD